MTNPQAIRPNWYTDKDDSAWSRVKAAFKRDWQQTENDFGVNVPHLNQQASDTIGQAIGTQPIPPGQMPTRESKASSLYRDEDEPNCRYGYAAYHHDIPESESEIDDWPASQAIIHDEWIDEAEWESQRDAIRRGWNYGRLERRRTKPK